MRALSEFRDVLESAALTLAMPVGASALGAALGEIVSDMEKALAGHDAATYREHDSRFHECIIRHSGNAYLVEAYDRIAFRVQTLRNKLSQEPALNHEWPISVLSNSAPPLDNPGASLCVAVAGDVSGSRASAPARDPSVE